MRWTTGGGAILNLWIRRHREVETMAPRIDDGLVSVEEYLEIDEHSEVRHEYVGGMLYAMGGGTDHHNHIALNIASKLHGLVGDGPCRVYINDMRFQIGNVYY